MMTLHLAFDLLAAALAVLATLAVNQTWLRSHPRSAFRAGEGYFLWLGLGVTLGSYWLGTMNLWLAGLPGFGRSILGALMGGIIAVELYKRINGLRGSTGLVLVPAFATLVAVGRIGCALSGLEDNTFGLPTTLPWGRDFGDGIPRHPVALYESAAMAGFLILSLAAFARRSPLFLRHGFYLMCAFYAAQRFLWEFLKPYPPLLGPFNLFHFATALLFAYALVMMLRTRDD